MQTSSLFAADAEVTPQNLGEALQQAIGIEIATIPVYLYTYYSINRVPDQNAISGRLVQELTRAGVPLDKANVIALDLSAKIMVFANKVGAVIMSVVMEEMLHMALASNIYQSLIGVPQLTGKSPGPPWPVQLPGHEPEFDIDLACFSLDQLMTFLKIESPDPLPDMLAATGPLPYKTIGEFYNMIAKCLKDNELTYNTDRPQLIPGRSFYAQNNINTLYYNKEHKPVYVNADDSGDLIHVTDRPTALDAINLIKVQGEGNLRKGLNPDGTVNCADPDAQDFDDADKAELCHFEKFAETYCHYVDLENEFKGYGLGEIAGYFVRNVPKNPTTAGYKDPAILAVATLIDAVYTYLFVMTEGCYKQDTDTQWETFMFGIHKSMIFILSSLCGDIQGLTYEENGQTYQASAAFENYPFGLMSNPKSQLIELYNDALALYPTISYLEQRFHDLPDVAL